MSLVDIVEAQSKVWFAIWQPVGFIIFLIAALAEVYYIDLIPHNNAGPLGSAATLHAALAIPNIALIRDGWTDIMRRRCKGLWLYNYSNGRYGFGFFVDRNFGNDIFGAPPTNFR